MGLAVCFGACNKARSGGTTVATASALATAPATAHPAAPEPDKTTSPAIAMQNFRSGLAQAERNARQDPASLTWATALLSARMQQVSDLGEMSALDDAEAIAARAVEDHPKDPKAHELAASAKSAIHDFAGARNELDEAEKLGANGDEIAESRAGIAMALGHYDEAHATFSKYIAKFAKPNRLLMDGVCLGLMGKTDEADAEIVKAEQAYRDVSPFFVSWLYFQRGNLWDQAGYPQKAIGYYRIAVERLPQYAHAVLHLSELLPAAEAKPLLEELAQTADDPEVQSSLSLVLDELQPGSGKDHFDKAKAGYEALMKKYPLAFADHAGWFYLNVAHEPDKALDAAKINADNRKTAQAYELMIAALLGTKKYPDACKTADLALKLPYPSVDLLLRGAAAYEECDKKPAADAIRAKLNGKKTGGRGR